MDRQGQLAELWRNWTPPPGLGHGTPRQIRLTGSGIAIVVTVVVMLAGALAVGIALDYLNRRQTQERRMLQLYGADTDAVVTRLWRRGDKNRTRWVAYQFSVEGRPYQRSRRVSAQRWRELQAGSLLPIRFLTTNPAISYPRGSEPKPMPLWLPYLAGFAMAGSSWLVAWSLQRQRRLLTEGRPAPGVVTRLSRMKGGMKVYYDFLLLSGSVAKGSSGPVSKPPGVGQTVCVLYHPDNPRRNAVYPLSLVKEDRLN